MRSVVQEYASKQREVRAVVLRISGRSYAQIATELGYASASGAYKATKRGLQRVGVEEMRQALFFEFEKLQELFTVVWRRVEKGDVKAVDQALSIIDRIEELRTAIRP